MTKPGAAGHRIVIPGLTRNPAKQPSGAAGNNTVIPGHRIAVENRSYMVCDALPTVQGRG